MATNQVLRKICIPVSVLLNIGLTFLAVNQSYAPSRHFMLIYGAAAGITSCLAGADIHHTYEKRFEETKEPRLKRISTFGLIHKCWGIILCAVVIFAILYLGRWKPQ